MTKDELVFYQQSREYASEERAHADEHRTEDVPGKRPLDHPLDPWQAVEKVFYVSLRAKRNNLAFHTLLKKELAQVPQLFPIFNYFSGH
jgi:hypothetical protein